MKAIERIYQYIDYKKLNKSDFERKCNISNGYLGKMHNRKADIGESILIQILENCPDMSSEWLLTGNGEMIKSSEKVVTQPSNNEYLVIRLEELIRENQTLKMELETLKNKKEIPFYGETPKLKDLAAEPANPQFSKATKAKD